MGPPPCQPESASSPARARASPQRSFVTAGPSPRPSGSSMSVKRVLILGQGLTLMEACPCPQLSAFASLSLRATRLRRSAWSGAGSVPLVLVPDRERAHVLAPDRWAGGRTAIQTSGRGGGTANSWAESTAAHPGIRLASHWAELTLRL